MTQPKAVIWTGALYAFVSYFIWGVTPIFWKQLTHFHPKAMLGYRVAWSCLILLILGLFVQRDVRRGLVDLTRFRNMGLVLAATGLIGINWYTYIWAVSHSRIVEASLGYYLNPLGNIAIGVLFFKEKLSPVRWAAFGLALAAVGILIVGYGSLPWISLILASSFAVYGMVKKLLSMSAAFTLGVETLLLLPLALVLVHGAYPGWTFITDLGGWEHALFFCSGMITLIPLFAFGKAAQLMPYSTLGFFQYIAPTLQLFCAVILYDEPFDSTRVIAFACIWVSLAAISYETLVRLPRQRARTPDLS